MPLCFGDAPPEPDVVVVGKVEVIKVELVVLVVPELELEAGLEETVQATQYVSLTMRSLSQLGPTDGLHTMTSARVSPKA
jgi:hypothetical protein